MSTWRLLSIGETAAKLGRSEREVRGMVSRGEFPAPCVKRIGRRIFLREVAVEAWLSEDDMHPPPSQASAFEEAERIAECARLGIEPDHVFS